MRLENPILDLTGVRDYVRMTVSELEKPSHTRPNNRFGFGSNVTFESYLFSGSVFGPSVFSGHDQTLMGLFLT